MIETGTEFARADDGVLWDGMARIARWDAVLGVHAESNDIAIQLRARLGELQFVEQAETGVDLRPV